MLLDAQQDCRLAPQVSLDHRLSRWYVLSLATISRNTTQLTGPRTHQLHQTQTHPNDPIPGLLQPNGIRLRRQLGLRRRPPSKHRRIAIQPSLHPVLHHKRYAPLQPLRRPSLQARPGYAAIRTRIQPHQGPREVVQGSWGWKLGTGRVGLQGASEAGGRGIAGPRCWCVVVL